MKNLLKTILPISLLIFGACGERTSVQTGEIGKVLGNKGLEKGFRAPGTFRMDYCGWAACPKLVRLQVNKSTADLEIDSLFLPKSNVDIKNVKIGLQFQVKSDEESIDKVFEEVRPRQADDQSGETRKVLIITDQMVYETYLKRKAPDAIIKTLRNHTVEEILTQVPEIAELAKNQVNEMLKDAPIEVTELGFPNGIGEPPKEVLVAKRNLFAIEENKKRELKSLEADLAVEDQRQAVQRKRAVNDFENAKIANVSYESYVSLKNQERFADAFDNIAEAIEQSDGNVIVTTPNIPTQFVNSNTAK